MPTRTKKRRPAPSPREGIHGRKDKKGSGRQGSDGHATPAPKIISHSLFALTLKPKPGIEVMEKVKGKKRPSYSGDDDYQQMYRDLLACFQNGVRLVTGEVTTFDPLASGLDIGASITYVLSGFETNVLPKGLEYNIDRDDQGYYFTIYDHCPFDEWWHAFEVKHVIHYLKKTNRKLHDLFIQFLHCFKAHTSINAWYDGACGYADYILEERIEFWDDHASEHYEDEEDAAKAFAHYKEAYDCYSTGEAKQYQELIKNARYRKPEAILKSLQKFNSRNKVVRWMKEACHFLQLPGCMSDFIYHEMEEEGGLEGLRFDQQISIIWDWDDALTGLEMECMDAEAQGCGVVPPVLAYHITRHTREFSHENFLQRKKWPAAVSQLFRSYNSMLEDIKPKKKKNDKQQDARVDVYL